MQSATKNFLYYVFNQSTLNKHSLLLSIVYMPDPRSTAMMQLSAYQIETALKNHRIGGHALTGVDRVLLSSLNSALVQAGKWEAGMDSFELSDPSFKEFIALLLQYPEFIRRQHKEGYALISVASESLVLDNLKWSPAQGTQVLPQLQFKGETSGRVYSQPLILNTTPLLAISENQIFICAPASAADIPVIEYLLSKNSFSYKDCLEVSNLISVQCSSLQKPPHNELQIVESFKITPVLAIKQTEPDVFSGKPEMYLELSYLYDNVLIEPKDPAINVICHNSEWLLIPRNAFVEKTAVHLLTQFGFFERPSKSSSLQIYPTRSVNWEYFLTKGVSFLKKQGWDISFGQAVPSKIAEVSKIDVNTKAKSNNWFEVNISVTVQNEQYNLVDLMASLFKADSRWLNKDKLQDISDFEDVLLDLKKGVFAKIQAKLLKPLALHIIDFFEVPDKLVHIQDIPRFKKGLEPLVGENTRLFDESDFLENFSTISKCTVPSQMSAALKSYQKDGLDWLQHLKKYNLGGILADDRGLGKTIQSIAHLAVEIFTKKNMNPNLILVETSLLDKWKSEILKFCPCLDFVVLQGKQLKANPIPTNAVVITTYTLYKQHLSRFEAISWNVLVLDEAQNAKNYRTATSQAISRLQCEQKICVTGTPLENNLSELWNLFNIIIPGFLGTYKEFGRIWKKPIELEQNILKAETLAARCAPFILLRTKQQVAPELPQKLNEGPLLIELSSEQRELYDSIHAAVAEKVLKQIEKSGIQKSGIVILDALLKLRQICCDPHLLGKSISSEKRKKAISLIQQSVSENKKVLVFSQFRSMLELLEVDLKNLNIPYSMLHGLSKNRSKQIDAFEKGNNTVFLISLKAGGKGLDLVSAQTVIIYDPWWNLASENQAIDRAHRIGQDKEVTIYKLVCKDTVEEKIVELQTKKNTLSQLILEKKDTSLQNTSISNAELLKLLTS